ncbi:hypothetical protein BaRGS_00037668 [Batillaria attramentaria]|uniref:Caffeoyl-CoA O-methyltransferase n=1 Tax=Batillaria attramentaria TaxID=370345 RepID=A0ABD0J829_9CAEN|nr:hypothetical protein BaRGS_027301 [Batillaria attramentaria]
MASSNKMHYDPTIGVIQKTLEAAQRTKADPEVIEGLERALKLVDLRDDYALQCSSQESAACREIVKLTLSHPWDELKKEGKTIWNLTPRMLSGPLEGQLLKSLVSIQRARRVLDVGMYTGYSALAMAEALPADGVVVTLDMDPYLEQLNRKSFAASPHGSKIQIRIGQAIDSMKEMVAKGEKFDFIFLDAEKSEYISYLKIALDDGLLAENGSIAVDNAFRHGAGYLPDSDPSNPTRQFGEYVAKNASLHKVLIPVRDGVMLIRRLTDVEREK